MKIYIATPINARREETFLLKCQAASQRCDTLRRMLRKHFPDVDIIHPFIVNPIEHNIEEPEAIGRCITTVMRADAVLFDRGWTGSKGCSLEFQAAKIYGKRVFCLSGSDEIEEIKYFVKTGSDMLLGSGGKTIDTL